jgi:hypothetical protein
MRAQQQQVLLPRGSGSLRRAFPLAENATSAFFAVDHFQNSWGIAVSFADYSGCTDCIVRRAAPAPLDNQQKLRRHACSVEWQELHSVTESFRRCHALR